MQALSTPCVFADSVPTKLLKPIRRQLLISKFVKRPSVCSSVRGSVMVQAVPFDQDANWNNALPRGSGRNFVGYVGKWGRYTAEGENMIEYNGVRLFKNNPDGVWDQTNIYSMQTPGSEPRQDGGFQKQWKYTKAEHSKPDGFFHPFMAGPEGPMRGRALAASPGRVTSISCALPLPEFVSQHDPPPPFVGGELFFRAPDESRSWSGGPLFDTKTGKVAMIFFIREYRVQDVDPEQPFQLDHPAVLPPRGKLSEDPATWLDGGAWSGVAEELVWGEDGRISHTPEHPTSWAPLKHDSRLTLLPDYFYVSCPSSIPTAANEIPTGGITIEMGGRTSETSFRKTLVSYGESGRIAQIRHEEFSRA